MMNADPSTQVMAWLAPRFDEMEALLQRLVNIDSSSHDKRGVDAVGDIIAGILAEDGIAIHRTSLSTYGDIFRAEVSGTGKRHAPPGPFAGPQGYGVRNRHSDHTPLFAHGRSRLRAGGM